MSHTTCTTIYKNTSYAVAPVTNENGFRLYVPESDGTIQELCSFSTNPNTGILAYGQWRKGFNSRQIGLNNVYHGTQVASTGWEESKLLVLFQVSNGDVRAISNRSGGWVLESDVVASGVPLGTKITAHSLVGSRGVFLGVLVVYADATGTLQQRFLAKGGWTAKSVVST